MMKRYVGWEIFLTNFEEHDGRAGYITIVICNVFADHPTFRVGTVPSDQ